MNLPDSTTTGPSTAVWAIVPAAGAGRRFREAAASPDALPKQLHRTDGRSMLAAVLDALDASRVAGVVAVVSTAVAAPIAAERPPTPRRRYVVNPADTSEMIESIQLGLRELDRLPPSAPGRRGVLVCPADHFRMNPAIVDACIDAFADAPDRIVIAACNGRAGHPVILPPDMAAAVAAWPSTRRLNSIRTEFAGRVTHVETRDPGAIRDADTPADLSGGP